MNIYEEQARWFRNISLLDPSFRACIHVEDKEDVKFWDYYLQKVAPGKYQFISQSKSSQGEETKGCEQCLKYKGLLSDRFFICIDSDLRLLLGQPELNAAHYIAQTHTYSWENHCCEADHLQTRLRSRIPDIDAIFDFRLFFRALSSILYHPLRLLVYYNKVDNSIWNLRKFNACIPVQARREQLVDNGKGLLDAIRISFVEATNGLEIPEGFDIGIEESQSYLHVQGHQIYNLTRNIGTQLCHGTGIAFTTEILNVDYPDSGYQEVLELKQDLQDIVETID